MASPRELIAAEIARLRAELERLEAAAALLDGAGPAAPAPHDLPRTREQLLADMVAAAGAAGLNRQQILTRMARVCDSPATSISTMLSRLQKDGRIISRNGRWYGA